MTVGWGDLKKGMAIELDGVPYEVIDYERQKMQQRAPVTRIRVRDLMTGKSMEKSFSGFSTSWKLADVETRQGQYLYFDGREYTFMDTGNYEQYTLTSDQVSDSINYMIENQEVEVLFYKNRPVSIRLPFHVKLKVTETVPGFKGDTATGGLKPATVETGLKINVPLHIKQGDTIVVDTRDGSYLERA